MVNIYSISNYFMLLYMLLKFRVGSTVLLSSTSLSNSVVMVHYNIIIYRKSVEIIAVFQMEYFGCFVC